METYDGGQNFQKRKRPGGSGRFEKIKILWASAGDGYGLVGVAPAAGLAAGFWAGVAPAFTG